MKALRVRLGSIDQLCRSLDGVVFGYSTAIERIGGVLEDYQCQLNDFFNDGLISEPLSLSMEVKWIRRPGSADERWDSALLRLECRSLSDKVAAFIQPFLGNYFMAIACSPADVSIWEERIQFLVCNRDYASFDKLFVDFLSEERFSPGIQVWMAGECGLGEAPACEFIVTGDVGVLEAFFLKLVSMHEGQIETSFSFGASVVEWMEIKYDYKRFELELGHGIPEFWFDSLRLEDG